MTESYFLSEAGFGLLVHSQSDKPLLLPCDAAIETLSEEAILYTLGELCEAGALTANAKNEKFDVSDTFRKILSAIVSAKTVVQYRGIFDEDTHFAYIGRDTATFVDIPANRLNKFRIGSVPTDSFAEEVMDRLDPNETGFSFPGDLTADLPQLSEENIRRVSDPASVFAELIGEDGVIALADFYPPDSAAVKARLCLIFADGALHILHIISGRSTREAYSPDVWRRLLTTTAEVSV